MLHFVIDEALTFAIWMDRIVLNKYRYLSFQKKEKNYE